MNMGVIGYGYAQRATFATDPIRSRGRLIFEETSPTRTLFQRDRDRIIHSNAFRRLKHKTQVFVIHESDHYRTRLTHTIEVAQIARALARALRLDEDLAEAIALVHDFGHPPFGHAGEDALDRIMARFGGFNHNAQSLRIVTSLENRYASFNGLNLTWETLEGLVKHNGPLTGLHASITDVPESITEFNRLFDLELGYFAGPEAQCAAIADDIAYNAHDIDDGLRSGVIRLEQFGEVELVDRLIRNVRTLYPDLNETRVAYELLRRQITAMVEDVITEAQLRLDCLQPEIVEDIYKADSPVICFSRKMAAQEKELKTFLYDNLYYHEKVLCCRHMGEHVVTQLFSIYMQDHKYLPDEWQRDAQILDDKAYALLVADFLSGMTDNYAIREYERLFDRKVNLF
ncbi:MAG: dGTPase [Candidatus Tokpelaia sp. JSC189]|nr:MAG: dGTPase [Candidatus Tokpelaia sp. JSC189]